MLSAVEGVAKLENNLKIWSKMFSHSLKQMLCKEEMGFPSLKYVYICIYLYKYEYVYIYILYVCLC